MKSLVILVMLVWKSSERMMTPGQEGMIQKKDLDKIISAHGLNIPSSRSNRQVDNNIDVDNISPQAPQVKSRQFFIYFPVCDWSIVTNPWFSLVEL